MRVTCGPWKKWRTFRGMRSPSTRGEWIIITHLFGQLFAMLQRCDWGRCSLTVGLRNRIGACVPHGACISEQQKTLFNALERRKYNVLILIHATDFFVFGAGRVRRLTSLPPLPPFLFLFFSEIFLASFQRGCYQTKSQSNGEMFRKPALYVGRRCA